MEPGRSPLLLGIGWLLILGGVILLVSVVWSWTFGAGDLFPKLFVGFGFIFLGIAISGTDYLMAIREEMRKWK